MFKGLHHFHKRKRIHEQHEPYPHPEHLEDVVAGPGEAQRFNAVKASEIEDDLRPNRDARALLFAARDILEADDCDVEEVDMERALWRLFDAVIHLAEDLGDTEVTSGLGTAHGWKMVRAPQ